MSIDAGAPVLAFSAISGASEVDTIRNVITWWIGWECYDRAKLAIGDPFA